MRRMIIATTAAVLLCFVPLGATRAASSPPSPGAAGIGDPYFPQDGNGGYDVSHYAISIGYTPSTRALTGHTVVSAVAKQSLSRFDLDLEGLTLDSLTVNGQPATWSRTAHELRITPQQALQKGSAFTVDARYHGKPLLLEEAALGNGGWFNTPDGAVVVGQPHVAATWFPVNDHPLDKATYAIDVTVPKGLEALSNGRLAGVTTQGAHTTWQWRMDKPMASYLATATTGQFDLRSYQRDGLSFVDGISHALFQRPQPRTGSRFALSGSQESGYQRLQRAIAVPASGGHLTFHVRRDTEPTWDFFFVEAHLVGTSKWTTLRDLNGHSSTDVGNSCPQEGWTDLHPFLKHYQTQNDDGTCSPTGTTGAWNAATGDSNGAYETWSVDLTPYAGKQVQIALSVAEDDTVTFPGVWVDDIAVPGGAGTTSFEQDGNALDGWTVPGAPAGSPGNDVDWTVAAQDTRPTVGDRARAVMNREPEILRFLERYLGPYPFKQAGGIVPNDPHLGFALENQTRPVYSKDFFQYGGVEDNDSVITHELAHQWTGDNLALGRWQDIWLNEGFATYMEWLWAEDQGRDTVQDIFDSYASIPADDPFWDFTIGDPGPDHLFDGQVYDRGAMTLQALRLRIGDAASARLVKKWTSTYAGGNVTTPKFIAMAEQVSGQQLDGFFRTWLYTPKKPAGLESASTLAKKSSSSSLTRKLLHERVDLRR